MASSPRLRAIITDLGQVVAPFERHRFAHGLRDLIWPSRPIDELDRLVNTGDDAVRTLAQFETGALSEEQFFGRIQGILGCALPAHLFWPLWCDIFTRNEAVIAFWRQAKEHDPALKLVALSDTDPRRLAHIQRLSRLTFDGLVASYMWGRRKPHPSMYRAAVELACCRPDECLFVDDIRGHVEGAQTNGLQGHHYDLDDPERDARLNAVLRDHGLIA